MSLPSTFRRWEASTFGGPAALELVERPLPLPGRGEVLLRVLATDCTYTDLMVLNGCYEGIGKSALPITPGYTCSARVAAVGAGVDSAQLSIGDAVLAMPMHGCAAEYLLLPARACVRVADAAGAAFVRARPELAASLSLTGVTAYQMLHRVAGSARLSAPDASILVHGAAGGTGAMLVQLAKLAGAAPARIIGTCSRKNMAAVSALGATAVTYEDAAWPAQVRAATAGGAGVCAAFDSTCDTQYSATISCIASGGIYVGYGVTNKVKPGSLALPGVLSFFAMKNVRHLLLHTLFCAADATFYNVGARRAALPAEYDDDVRTLVELAASGRLEVIVGKTHALSGVKTALESIAAGEHRGKQCVIVAHEE